MGTAGLQLIEVFFGVYVDEAFEFWVKRFNVVYWGNKQDF